MYMDTRINAAVYQGDYIADALLTKSAEFHANLVGEMHSSRVFDELVRYGNELDKIKKALFYGRGEPPEESKTLEFVPNIEAIKKNADIVHAVFGKITESIELLEALKPLFLDGEEVDKVNLLEEIGDGQWYDAILVNAIGKTIVDAQTANIAKMRKRYPGKFSAEAANNRDLAGEREILQKGMDKA